MNMVGYSRSTREGTASASGGRDHGGLPYELPQVELVKAKVWTAVSETAWQWRPKARPTCLLRAPEIQEANLRWLQRKRKLQNE